MLGHPGAIFGLYGALLGFLALRRHGLPPDAARSLLSFAFLFLGYNLIHGLTSPETDLAAHGGGLVGGFVCGLGLSFSPAAPNARRRLVHGIVALAAAVALFAIAKGLPRTFDFQKFWSDFSGLDQRTVAKYNAALNRYRSGGIPANDLARVVETQVVVGMGFRT